MRLLYLSFALIACGENSGKPELADLSVAMLPDLAVNLDMTVPAPCDPVDPMKDGQACGSGRPAGPWRPAAPAPPTRRASPATCARAGPASRSATAPAPPAPAAAAPPSATVRRRSVTSANRIVRKIDPPPGFDLLVTARSHGWY